MKQKEADKIAIELLNLQETLKTKGVDRTVVVANRVIKCLQNIRRDHPMIDDAMNEIEIMREDNN